MYRLKFARLALLTALAAFPVLSQAEWTEASSRHFVVYSEAKPEQVRAVAEELERFDSAIRYVRQLPDVDSGPANRVTIYILDSVIGMETLRGRGAERSYVARAGGSLALAFGANPVYSADAARAVLFNQYAHHLLLSNHSLPWPDWLYEGYARFYLTADVGKDGGTVGMPYFTGSFLGDGLRLPIARMLRMEQESFQKSELTYSRSWLFVHYLTFEATRSGQLDNYLQLLARGVSSVDAATAAFGDLAALDQALDSYLSKPFKYLKVPGDAIKVAPITLRELSPGEQAVMELRIRSKAALDEKQPRQLVRRMRAAVAPFPSHAIAQVALAEVEFKIGNFSEAEAAADRAMTADPKLVDAYIYKARAQMAVACRDQVLNPEAWTEVRKWLVAANRLDPDHPEPLVRFYLSFHASGQIPTQNAVAGLNRAHELAPQDPDVRLLLAFQYLADGKVEQARKALALTVWSPHAGEVGTTAAAALERIEQVGTATALEALGKQGLAQVLERW